MPASKDWSDDTGSLRRFGLALARDDRFVLDDATAGRLVDKLIRQSHVAPIDAYPTQKVAGKVRAFARFIELYRRHIRKLALEDFEANWNDGAFVRGGPIAINGVRALPLELREALLLVALSGFSHLEATQALDIPLARLIERLDRARERLAEHMGANAEHERADAWLGAPHLRIIK